MKQNISFFVALSFLAYVSFAITPITGFNEGEYSGSADWIAQDGSSGHFSAFLDLDQTSWTLARFEVANVFIYKTILNIDSEGFIEAEMIDETDPASPIYYPGYGNCGTNYCQWNIYLYNGNLWKEFVFNSDNTISFAGAIHFDDGSSNVQWEGSLILLP